MDWKKLQPSAAALWALVEEQHGVVTRRQLLEHGLSSRALDHRIAVGRLHRISRGVYAVGRPTLTARGRWMAAVLGCGPQAALSHSSAAALWGIARSRNADGIEVSVPAAVCRRRRGVILHRRPAFGPADVTRREGIPVTSSLCTLIDLAARLDPRRLEAAINEADKLDLIDPETLRAALDDGRRPGTSALRASLDRATFVLTDSELERRFLPLARRAGLPRPETGRVVNGFKVDFHWPSFGLVVETDGLRYHRTAGQQARDRVRDQVHTAAGLIPLRFTHAQVAWEPGHVEATLRAVTRRTRAKSAAPRRSGAC